VPEFRIVTLAEARGALPAVRDILAAMRDVRHRLAASAGPASTAGANGHTNGHRSTVSAGDSTAQSLHTALRGGIERLAALGCEVKDLEQGLIDFHAMREGREVYLCWRNGEDDIRFWHEIDTGFAGRRRLEESEWQ